MVHSFAAFRESAEQMTESQIPLRIWVRFQLVENDDGTHSLFTQGLKPLGFHIQRWEITKLAGESPAIAEPGSKLSKGLLKRRRDLHDRVFVSIVRVNESRNDAPVSLFCHNL